MFVSLPGRKRGNETTRKKKRKRKRRVNTVNTKQARNRRAGSVNSTTGSSAFPNRTELESCNAVVC
jgi:hypothetical protein